MSILEKYTTNYSNRVQNSLDNVIGRQNEINEIIVALLRKTKNAPLLVGEPGVGKTAIIEGLAKRILDKNVPERLKGYEVLSLDIARMTGDKFENEFAELIQELTKESWHYIIFIDEFHMIMGAGSNTGTLDATNMLKPALARGDFKLIGATTTDEYHDYLEGDGALDRRLSLINVDEPDEDETVEILTGILPRYEATHDVKYDSDVLRMTVQLTNRYLTTKFQPDKSMDILDSAGARVEIIGGKQVTKQVIQDELETLAGIPSGSLERSDFERLELLEDRLTNHVIGQPVATNAVQRVLKRSLTGLSRKDKPLGNLLFVGPTGVGKSAMVKELAKTIFDSEKNIIRFDMTEFSLENSVDRFRNELTRQVKRQPYTVILLDEVEKAHSLIFDLFLQVFQDGVLSDEFSRTVTFKNTIIIATSNMGYELMTDGEASLSSGDSDQVQSLKDLNEDFDFLSGLMREELKRIFRPEFLNRLDEIVMFNFLGRQTIRKISEITIDQALADFEIKYGLDVKYDESLIDYITNVGYDQANGARPIQRSVEQNVTDALTNLVIKETNYVGDLPVKNVRLWLKGEAPTGLNDRRILKIGYERKY